MTIGVPVVTCLPRLYQQCTNRQNSQKQSKDSQNSKNQSSHVYMSAEYTVRVRRLRPPNTQSREKRVKCCR